MSSIDLPPRIVEYSDYHRYLRDFYNFKKTQNRRFSFRRFSQLAEIKSSNYLMLVMDGKRKLMPSTARRVVLAMRLNKYEGAFFIALVKQERARNAEEIQEIETEKRICLKKMIHKNLPLDKAEYLSHWFYPLVRELAFLPDFEPSAQWIATKLKGLITLGQAEKSLSVLVNLGLWKVVKGQIVVSDIFLDTGDDDRIYSKVSVVDIHKQNLLSWAKIIGNIPSPERELGLINIPINAKHIPELKARLQKFQDEIIGWLQDEDKPTRLVQLGTYLVPVT